MADPADQAYKFLLRTGPGLQYPETQDLQKAFDEKVKRKEEVYQAQRAAHGDTGMDWDRLGGEAVTTMAPGFSAMKAIAPANVAGRMMTGIGSGLGYSQIQTDPEENLNPPATDKEYWDRQTGKAKVGAAIGAAFPLIGTGLNRGARWAKETIIDPWSDAGKQREVNRFLRNQS